jgi:hypothetical protein
MMAWFRQNLLNTILLIALVLTLHACSKNNSAEAQPDLGLAYFPLDSGWVKVYSVDSISFNDNTETIDTFHFMLKETFAGIISGQELNAHREVKREVLKDSSEIWEPRTSIFITQDKNTLQWVEENTRFVKLIFPIGTAQSWNGNAYNSLGRKNYQWQNLYANFNNGDTLFSNCISVLEAQTNNLIEEILIRNVYAKNLGLIDRTNTNINTQSNKKSGYKIRQKLKSFTRP